ncbi:hypothetical protein DV532_29860 (plasmid) [Pseudomonas sp. Leaf58]|uniref:hypothetical protein n=1 Tax=Pseudomonas sp. Leaf58 TaxID=1736226 RepID=UPI0006FD0251|nr:hypothetical protein [Pseudomonas sp. Leaf58]AYG48439.1 hypothetical protein DV532_29860 [Pseudomonas sp. Leaf58]KQN62016.1 hypothetical protein ASF02_07460 [Pseudomonas sp. Leaf58]
MSLDLAELLTLDIEASSYNNDESYPVSIGIAGPGGQTWYRLVCPLEHWDDWDPVAEILHGIERETIITHGRDAFLVARELNAMLAGKTLIVDSPWDIQWMKKLYDDVDVSQAFSVLLFSDHLPAQTVAKIHEQIEVLNWPHVANEDAVLLRKILAVHCMANTEGAT